MRIITKAITSAIGRSLIAALCAGGMLAASEPVSASVAPMPLISLNAPAYASDRNADAGLADNAQYTADWRSYRTPSTSAPCWLAYDLSAKKPTTVDLVWYNDASYGYNYDLQDNITGPGGGYNCPVDYEIEVNAAPGGTGAAPAMGWVTRAVVTGNYYHSREAVVDMTGYNWIRISVTASSTEPQNTDVAIDMDVYDVSAGIQDTWLFTGDSITAGGMTHTPTTFAQGVNMGDSHFPLEENAGLGGWTAAGALAYMPTWLALYPGHFVTIDFGTNDVNTFPGDTGAINSCIANLSALADDVIAAGKVPVIPHIPWANLAAIQANGPVLNAGIDALIKSNPQIIAGPDLYTFFKNNPSLISSDNLHPSAPDGWQAYRNQWSLWALANIYPTAVSVAHAPTNLRTTAGNTTGTITWTAVSGAASYSVYRGASPGAERATAWKTGITKPLFTNTGLTNGTTYYYKVTAVNGAGESVMSAEVSVTPEAGLPVAPTGVAATAGNATATITWTAVSGATSYNVYRGTSPGNERAAAWKTGITKLLFTNTGLTNGTPYYYTVTAVNGVGESHMSAEVSATPAP